MGVEESLGIKGKKTKIMNLSFTEQSLLVAAYFRGNTLEEKRWFACSDQIITLSLFYTNDITAADCQSRFLNRGYVGRLYDDASEGLHPQIKTRYKHLIQLLHAHPRFIKGSGNFDLPTDPTYTACRLTEDGIRLIPDLIRLFPRKPDFPDWPDRRTHSHLDEVS